MSNDIWKQQIESCLTLIKLKHQPAFEELYKLSSAKLYGLILKMIPDKETAADILQESFTKIWQQAEKYRADLGGAWAWICQLTRNTAIDKIRTMQRQPNFEESSDLNSLVSSGNGIWEDEKDLSRCLQKIKREPRMAIIQAYIYGFSHAELADRMQTPLGTLKSWIKRGLKDLQQCLNA